jgi:hypothetical protein
LSVVASIENSAVWADLYEEGCDPFIAESPV